MHACACFPDAHVQEATQPSSYVSKVLQPLNELMAAHPRCYDSESSLRSHVVSHVLEKVWAGLEANIGEVLQLVESTQQTLSKLQKKRKGADPAATSDDVKILRQLQLDVEAIAAEVPTWLADARVLILRVVSRRVPV